MIGKSYGNTLCIGDDISGLRIYQIINKYFGKNYAGWMMAWFDINDEFAAWFPTITKTDKKPNGSYGGTRCCSNVLSSDRKTIMETNHEESWSSKDVEPSKFDKKRLVFGRINGRFEFLGIFTREPVYETEHRTYKHTRIATGIDLDTFELIYSGHITLDLDPEISPEAIEFFANNELSEFSSYELASALADCDRNSDMPRNLFDFIVNCYQDAIASGDVNAMNDLGALYYNGRGCEQDFKKAIHYYEMAAGHGHRIAQENLGYCYYYGRDIPVDYEKAFHYYALASFAGSLIALYKIGDMYQNGYYVEKNPEEAFIIYDRCASSLTDDTASFVAGPVFLRLGNCFLNGNGIDENPMSALICFQRAEQYLYEMVAGGDYMYKKSLQTAIDGQTQAREKLEKALPKKEWKHE